MLHHLHVTFYKGIYAVTMKVYKGLKVKVIKRILTFTPLYCTLGSNMLPSRSLPLNHKIVTL